MIDTAIVVRPFRGGLRDLDHCVGVAQELVKPLAEKNDGVPTCAMSELRLPYSITFTPTTIDADVLWLVGSEPMRRRPSSRVPALP
jgi:hypothetical protein